MPMSVAVRSLVRSALLALTLIAAPALAWAQSGAGTGARVESIVVTAPSVRVRTAPYMSSLSIDEFGQGTVFPLASEDYHSKDWFGVMVDGRVAYVPRYAVALKGRSAAPARASEPTEVAQSGAPAPVIAAPTRALAPAPVTVAARPAPVEPTRAAAAAPAGTPLSVTTPAQAPSAAVAAPPRPAPAAAPAVVARAPERVAAQEPARAPERAPERTAAPAAQPPAEAAEPAVPAVPGRRAGVVVSLGVLASVTPVNTAGLTPNPHIAGLSFIGAKYRGFGVYVAPEVGSGGNYRSTMLGGGLSADLLNLHLLRVTALGGYTTYTETPTPADTTAPAGPARSFRGPSVGGMVSVPLFGPLRLAYRGQYAMLKATGATTTFNVTRYSFGLMF